MLTVVLLSMSTLVAADPPPQLASATPAVDRLQLDSTAVTGNRELPRVMSIVPWKAPEPPGGPDRPMGSLIEQVLAPLDRDEFRREITYFNDLSTHSSAAGGPDGASPRAVPSPGPAPGPSTVATGDTQK
jgi:hypothetical protein